MRTPGMTVIFGAFVLCLALSQSARAIPEVGDHAIDFVIRNTENQEIRLFDYAGRVVYMVLWIPG